MEKGGGDGEGRVEGCFFCSHFAGVSHLTRTFERAAAERWLRLSLTSEPAQARCPGSTSRSVSGWKSGASRFPWRCQERRQRRPSSPLPLGPLQVPPKHSANSGWARLPREGAQLSIAAAKTWLPPKYGVGGEGQGAKPPFE